VQVKMIRPMCSLVGGGGKVSVGGGGGKVKPKGCSRTVKLIGLAGINKHSPITMTTRIKPIGK
jgi:hypothetical protein